MASHPGCSHQNSQGLYYECLSNLAKVRPFSPQQISSSSQLYFTSIILKIPARRDWRSHRSLWVSSHVAPGAAPMQSDACELGDGASRASKRTRRMRGQAEPALCGCDSSQHTPTRSPTVLHVSEKAPYCRAIFNKYKQINSNK